MGALQEVLAKFTIDVDTGPLKAAGSAIGGVTAGLGKIGSLVAGGAVIAGIKGMTSEMVDLAGSLVDTSNRLGISTNDLQQWQFFAKKAGADAGDLEPAFRVLQKNIAEIGGEAAKGAGIFKTLGVETKDAAGNMRPMGEIATDAGLAIAGLDDPAQRSKAALEVFGKAGTKLLPLFQNGREGMGAFADEFEKFGGAISEDTIATLDAAGDASDDFELALTGLKAQIVVGLAPALTAGTTKLASVLAAFKKGGSEGNHLRNVLVGVGIAGAVAGGIALAPWLATIAALVVAGLVVDDVITAFEGGQSVLTDFLDAIFGDNAGKDIMKAIRDDTQDLWAEIDKAPTARAKFDAAFDGIGTGLKNFFETDLPAAIGVATGHINGTETTWGDLWQSSIKLPITSALASAGDAVAAFVLEAARMIRNGTRDAVAGALRPAAANLGGFAGDQAAQLAIDKLLGKREVSAETDARVFAAQQAFSTSNDGAFGALSAAVQASQVTQNNPTTINITTTDVELAGTAAQVLKRATGKNNDSLLAALEALK